MLLNLLPVKLLQLNLTTLKLLPLNLLPLKLLLPNLLQLRHLQLRILLSLLHLSIKSEAIQLMHLLQQLQEPLGRPRKDQLMKLLLQQMFPQVNQQHQLSKGKGHQERRKDQHQLSPKTLEIFCLL